MKKRFDDLLVYTWTCIIPFIMVILILCGNQSWTLGDVCVYCLPILIAKYVGLVWIAMIMFQGLLCLILWIKYGRKGK